jgi:hypothetical protein
MSERSCLTGLLAAGLLLPACQETPLEPTDPSAGRQAVLISTAPDPTYAVPSTGVTFDIGGELREYAFFVSFDLILEVEPGIDSGFSVSSDSLVLQQLLSVIPDGPGGGVDRERYEYTSRSEGDRIEPGGRTSRTFDVWYTLPLGGREARIIVTLEFVDDVGVVFSRTHDVRVQP